MILHSNIFNFGFHLSDQKRRFGLSKERLRKVMLNLDVEDMDWLAAKYGKTLGVSQVVRKLIANHRAKFNKVLEDKYEPVDNTTGVSTEQADEVGPS